MRRRNAGSGVQEQKRGLSRKVALPGQIGHLIPRKFALNPFAAQFSVPEAGRRLNKNLHRPGISGNPVQDAGWRPSRAADKKITGAAPERQAGPVATYSLLIRQLRVI
jgi:hypothetical protein